MNDTAGAKDYDLGTGWTARYEIWSIVGDTSKVIDLKVQLNPEEVKLQMQQSLWRDQNVNEKFNPTDIELKLQFPVSISPDVRTFVVLRTVYVLREDEENELRLHSSMLPMDFNERNTHNWTLRPEFENADQSVNEIFYEYLYWMYFSPDGNNIFFIDNEFGEPSTIAVLEMTKSNALHFRPVGVQVAHIAGFDEKRQGANFSFHPSEPLVAFTIANTVFFWVFDSCK